MGNTRTPAAREADPVLRRPYGPSATGVGAAPFGHTHEDPPVHAAARYAMVLGAMAILMGLADYLGASWVRASVLGVPVGVWFAVLLTPGFVWFTKHHRRVVRVDKLRSAARSFWPAVWPEGLIGRVWDRIGALGETIEFWASGYDGACEKLIALHDRAPWPARPIRVAVAGPDGFFEALRDAPSSAARPVEWSRFDSEIDPVTAMNERGVDAVVWVCQGVVTVMSPEREDRDASWFDWSMPRPISYASVYPLRVDGARFTLPELPAAQDTRLVRDLIEAMAVLGRSPWRLGLAERINGRRPYGEPNERSAHENEVMRSLGELVRRGRDAANPSRALEIAARLVSAWAVGASESLVETDRIALLRAAAGAVPDEPEGALRLSAALLAAGEDDRGIDALLRADALLRQTDARERFGLGLLAGSADHARIVQTEIEFGGEDDATLGRVAGGVCLLAATTETDRLAFLREDLMEEFRYAGWLVGRETDAVLLRRIILELERARENTPISAATSEDRAFPRRAA